MNEQTQQLIDNLLTNVKDADMLNDLSQTLYKKGIESLLAAEMEAHLGHSKGDKPSGSNIRNGHTSKTLKTTLGPIPIQVPRDRESSFEPVIVPKHQTITQAIEEMIISLYAKGMSTADIIDFVESTYGLKYSTSQVSVITNTLLDDIREWQNRPLQDQYAVVWIDAIHYKIREDGQVSTRAGMVVLGIDMEGKQDILSLEIVAKECAAAWSDMLSDLKIRGVKDILLLCSDNLSGLDKAIEAVYPDSLRQICIVHQIRNSLKHVAHKDRKAIVKDIKGIYQADNPEMARQAFDQFSEKWRSKYYRAVKSWEDNWDNLTTFLQYPKEIRKLIYTTNIIESFNAVLRKHTRNKKVFPTDDAALKSMYLAIQQISKKWKKTRHSWSQIYNQLTIYFENRIFNQ